MNADLDCLLSAYLDGELDDLERRRVEHAIGSDPVVSVRLAALSRVRDLVATLSSPSMIEDQSGPILRRLARREPTPPQTATRRRFWVATLVPALAAAASLVVMFARGWPVPSSKATLVLTHPPARTIVAPPAPVRPAAPPRPIPVLANVSLAIPSSILADETKASEARDLLTNMLGRGDVRVISVTVDTFGPSSMETLDDAIRSSNFREERHARIRIVQNITIDPDRPGPGCAYALVMDEAEHRLFRSNLEVRFKGAVTETTTPPSETLAMLPSTGRVEVFRSVPRATLLDPPANAANKIATRPPKQAMHGEVIVEVDPRGGRHPQPRPDPPVARPHEPVARATDKPARPADLPVQASNGEPPSAVYLVWLTARSRS